MSQVNHKTEKAQPLPDVTPSFYELSNEELGLMAEIEQQIKALQQQHVGVLRALAAQHGFKGNLNFDGTKIFLTTE